MTSSRPTIVGLESGPQSPFPMKVRGPVIKGFGRGSKELGIPTANIPVEGLSVGGHEEVESGIYFGWAGLERSALRQQPSSSSLSSTTTTTCSSSSLPPTTTVDVGDVKNLVHDPSKAVHQEENANPEKKEKHEVDVFEMVMSIGWNPFYKNTKRSVEVHLLHNFSHDFYGAQLNLLIMGFIRPESDYVSMQALIDDIHYDIRVAKESLARDAWSAWKADPFLLLPPSPSPHHVPQDKH